MAGTDELSGLRIERTRRRRGGLWRWLGWLALLLVIGAGVAAFTAGRGVEVSAVTVEKPAEGAKPGDVARLGDLTAAGYIVADRQSTMAAKTTGRLSQVLIHESQHVKKGDLIAEVDHTELDATIRQARNEEAALRADVDRLTKDREQAEADAAAARTPIAVQRAQIREMQIVLADAKRRYARDKVLAESAAGPESNAEDRLTEVHLAEAKLATAAAQVADIEARAVAVAARVESVRAATKVAEAQATSAASRVQVLEAQLLDYRIYTPFDGVVTEKLAEVGEIVAPISIGGQMARGAVATVADWNSLQAEVDVAEAYIGRVRVGGKAVIRVDAFPDLRAPGTVLRVLPKADRSKATVKARLDFDARDPRILPDMGVRVVFLAEDASSPPAGAAPEAVPVCVLPRKAVLDGKGARFVWVVKEGAASKRTVVTGREADGRIEVLQGLDPGDRVVTAGAEDLAEDGQRVRIQEAK